MSAATGTADADQTSPDRPPAPAPARRHRLRGALGAVAALAVLLATDAALVGSRVAELDVELHPGAGTTWVLVGLDSREALPAGASVSDFGTPADVPGSRADVIVVVHETADGATTFSVPRDVVVRTGQRSGRLALTWLDGPQGTVDALCDLGIPTDHLVTVDLAGFAAVVDAAGGLAVHVPVPVRDPAAGLQLDRAGDQHVDGATALALVRSRHPEHRVDGQWAPAPVDPDGRASAAGAVLSALSGAVQASVVRPWRLQQVAWTAAGALTVDRDTSLAELTRLARADVGDVRVLPVSDPVGATIARRTTEATGAAVAAAGMSCRR